MQIIQAKELQSLIAALRSRGYTVVGPTARDGAIITSELTSAEDLPKGWSDEQEGGTYRLQRRGDEAFFGFTVGPHSFKKFLFPPYLRLYGARTTDKGFEITDGELEEPNGSADRSYAFFGIRSCELAALALQDKIFMGSAYTDPYYRRLREKLFIVAVNCTRAGGTCFCASMNTGPRCQGGYDLALTEILGDHEHFFVTEVGSPAGEEVLSAIRNTKATAAAQERAEAAIASAAGRMGRTLDTANIQALFTKHFEHPHWDDVARRCLICSNCTMVCPTCFCATVEERTDLSGEHAQRWRKWDSCFTTDFSYIHGGSVRSSAQSRYRQWITHKLSAWKEQFGTLGCVGCGRCITWCPVGLDITAETRALRQAEETTLSQP